MNEFALVMCLLQSLEQYFPLTKLSKDIRFQDIELHKFSTELSQNLTLRNKGQRP